METDKANDQQEQDSQEGEQQAVRAKWPKHPWGRDPIVWFTGVIAACAIVQGSFAYYQRQDSKESSKQTQAIVETQEDIAGDTHASALAAQQAATAIENSVVQAEKATRQTLEESRKSLDATIEMARNEQRAWVGAVAISKPEIREGLQPRISIPLTNSGKTPAKTVTVEFGATISPCKRTCDKAFKADYIPNEDTGPQGVAVLQPNARHSLDCIRKDPFTKEEVAGIASKTMFFVVYGRINYKDVFRRDHEAKFAYRWVPDVPAWRSCGDYNTAD